MKNLVRLASGLALLAGLASCHGIGSGNTIKSLKIVFYPVTGEQATLLTPDNTPGATTNTLRMYDCFCSTIVVYGYFEDGTIGDFTTRATFSSSDPGTVEVSRFDTTKPCAFTQNDPSLVTLTPHKVSASPVTITAQFIGLKATLKVDVLDTATALNGTLVMKPSDPNNTGEVAVASTIRELITGTLNGTPRTFNNNVYTYGSSTLWSMQSPSAADCTVPRTDGTPLPNDCKATLSKSALAGGFVSGIEPTASTPATVTAQFGACPTSSLNPITASVKVGDIVQPLSIAEEDAFYPASQGSDQTLATDSNEFLKVTSPLDFRDGNGATGSYLLSSSSGLTYTGSCTKRTFLAGGDGSSPLPDCSDQATTCDNTVPVCTAMASCTSTNTPCRTAASQIVPALFNRIVANADSGGNAVSFNAQFPAGALGTQTHLSSAVAGGSDTVVVDALTGFPTTFPWYGVIDKNGTREDVRVVSATGTSLKVVRAQGGTADVGHGQGDTFDERSYTSTTPVPVTSKDGTLVSLGLFDSTGTNSVSNASLNAATTPSLAQFGTLQLQAIGGYDGNADGNADRQQSVTHLTAANNGPSVSWVSSDTSVAVVGFNTGLVTSVGVCGGRAVIRAVASRTTNTSATTFVKPAAVGDSTDTDRNDNTDTNDAACLAGDPFCDQLNVCVATPNPLPPGVTCPTTTTCP